MSLGFRLPNFLISQIVLAHLSWGLLGNWEIGKYVPVTISQFPNFPNRAELHGLRSFAKLGNWEICTSSHFPISQFPKSCWPIWAGVFWEIGKWIGRYLFINRGCVYKHGLGAPINIPFAGFERRRRPAKRDAEPPKSHGLSAKPALGPTTKYSTQPKKSDGTANCLPNCFQ